MKPTEYEDAKELFVLHRGRSYFMAREERLEEYRRYRVPEIQEHEWRREMAREALDKLETASENMERVNQFTKYGSLVEDMNDEDGPLVMRDYVEVNLDKLDSHTASILINNILRCVGVIRDRKLRQTVISECIGLLETVLNKPIYISNDYIESYGANFRSEEDMVKSLETVIKYGKKMLRKVNCRWLFRL